MEKVGDEKVRERRGRTARALGGGEQKERAKSREIEQKEKPEASSSGEVGTEA